MESLIIDDYGVPELSSSEMRDIDGGCIILTAICLRLLFDDTIAFLDGRL